MSDAKLPAYLGKTIDYWIEQLQSQDPLVRRLSSHALSMIGPDGKSKSIPALLTALDDPESFVRVWVAAALARVDPHSQQALKTLIAGLRDEHSFVRSLAAWHLSRNGPDMPEASTALPFLQDLLNDEDPSVRAEAELAWKVLQIESVRARG
jgi:HEAT repeat protein